MQQLRDMMSQLSNRLESFEDSSRVCLPRTGTGDNRSKSLSPILPRTGTGDNRSKSLSPILPRTGTGDNVERSLSPILIRNKGRNRRLSPMSRSYKRTLHVCYTFIVKIYLLFNL
jgi:hypothetical protein